MKAIKKLWPLIANPKVLLTFAGVLFAIAALDMWMRGCNDINIWPCLSWIGKSCSAILGIGVFGWAFFWVSMALWNGLKWLANLVKL